MCPFYKLEHLLGICSGVVLLDLLVELCPISWETAKMISRLVVPACSSTNNGGVFLFLHILDSICCQLSFRSQSFWLVWGGISVLFWFAFLWWLRMLNIFLGVSQPLELPQLRIFCSALFPIFKKAYLALWSLNSWVCHIHCILALYWM
jgi:hypothetical protein